MKRNIKYALIFILFFTGSCEKEDKLITGRWDGISFTTIRFEDDVKTDEYSYTYGQGERILEFLENGNGNLYYYSTTLAYTFTWKISKDQLKIVWSGKATLFYEFNINETRLYLKSEDIPQPDTRIVYKEIYHRD
jgi:hypothetical protein